MTTRGTSDPRLIRFQRDRHRPRAVGRQEDQAKPKSVLVGVLEGGADQGSAQVTRDPDQDQIVHDWSGLGRNGD